MSIYKVPKATHRDIVLYIKKFYRGASNIGSYFEERDGKFFITHYIVFDDWMCDDIPDGVVFENTADFDDSRIKVLDGDITIVGDLLLQDSSITTINVDVGGRIDIRGTNAVLKDGIFIGDKIWCTQVDNKIDCPAAERYAHIDSMMIHGYLFSTGVLS